MDKISNINSIVNILREQISGKTGSAGPASRHGKTGANPTATVAAARPLQQILQERLKKLRKNDSDYPTRARKVLVESILTCEFGDNIVNDPAYGELFDRVFTACNSEEQIVKRIDVLLNSQTQHD